MSLILHIIVTYIKGNIIRKLQKLYSLPRNPRVNNKSPMIFVKKPLSTGDLSPACKIFTERPDVEENLGQANIRRGIFQGDCLSPLLFMCLLLFTHILRDAAPGYHFASKGQKVNHLLFMDGLSYVHAVKSHLNP